MDRVETDYAIRVKDVAKIYRLYDKPTNKLKESLHPLYREYHKKFYALNSISFNMKKGETVGIIGTNGPGKSTILKIITSVLSSTAREVGVVGMISALPELSTGFNMDYIGIENIYMNGTMMGFSRRGMDEKLQDILDSADIGDFVYRPVKAYSSGMSVHLTFALAINVEPEILIVDEALSVGDAFFQSRCYRRVEEIHKKGATILMVTHGVGSIIKYCDKVVLSSRGSFVAEGGAGHMVDLYKRILASQMNALNEELEEMNDFSGEGEREISPVRRSEVGLMEDKLTINSNHAECGDRRAEIYDLGLFDERGSLTSLLLEGESFTTKEKIRFHTAIQSPIFTYTIKDKKGTNLTGVDTMFGGTEIKPVKAGNEYEVSSTQKMTLQGGEYLLSMSRAGFRQGGRVVCHRLYDVANVTVISSKNTVGVYDMKSQVEARYVRAQVNGAVRRRWWQQERNRQTSDTSREIMDLLERYGAGGKLALREHGRLDYLYALSDMRENLLEWYPFWAEGRLLQIGSDYGAMTGLYCQRIAGVVVPDESQDNLETNRMHHREEEHVTYVHGTLEDYVNQSRRVECFDYAIFVGSVRPDYEAYMHGVKRILKPGGELIVAVCNPFGMKYWTGTQKDEFSYSRNTLAKLLAGTEGGMNDGNRLRFYCLMSGYKLPISIYSQSYLPEKGDLTSMLTAYDYPKCLLLSIGASCDAVCEDGQFENFANSFLAIWRKYGTN